MPEFHTIERRNFDSIDYKTAKMSLSLKIKYSLPSYFTSVPAYLEKMITSPLLLQVQREFHCLIHGQNLQPPLYLLVVFLLRNQEVQCPEAVFSSTSTNSIIDTIS